MKVFVEKGKKAYIVWEYNDIESSYDEETNIYLMVNHQDDEVASYFSYQDLALICKKIKKDMCEL